MNTKLKEIIVREKIKNDKLIYYLAFLLFLIIITLCNNFIWKFGKQQEKIENNIDYFESNNVIYNVPYEEKALD